MEVEKEKVRKTDRRIVKTKRAICNAFADLLSVKDFNEITIKDIADTADVNRKTVYNYYSGIHEILDEIENEIVLSFEKVIKDFDFKSSLENPYKIFEKLNSVIGVNLDFYGRLLRINGNSNLVDKIVSTLMVRSKKAFLDQKVFPENKVDTVVNFLASGMIAAYQNWFLSGKDQSLEEFSKDIAKIVYSGVSSIACK